MPLNLSHSKRRASIHSEGYTQLKKNARLCKKLLSTGGYFFGSECSIQCLSTVAFSENVKRVQNECAQAQARQKIIKFSADTRMNGSRLQKDEDKSK